MTELLNMQPYQTRSDSGERETTTTGSTGAASKQIRKRRDLATAADIKVVPKRLTLVYFSQ